jgi:voltage-gated potassium channel Kch
VTAGATFDAQRQAIINGLDSAQSELTGWNNEVRDKEVVTSVARTSDTVCTITLSASASYDISATETITVTIPSAALTTGTSDIIGTPTFTVTAVVSGFQVAWAANANTLIN